MIFVSSLEAQSRREYKRNKGYHKQYNSHNRKHHNDVKSHTTRRTSGHYDAQRNVPQHQVYRDACNTGKKVYYQRDKHHTKHHNYAYNYHNDRNHHYNRHAVRYLRQLPTHHYISIEFRDDTYFYCDGRFYSYQPGCGYHAVDLHLHSVEHIPQHCTSRVVNGRQYYYKEGYYYIPHSNGHYRVCNVSLYH